MTDDTDPTDPLAAARRIIADVEAKYGTRSLMRPERMFEPITPLPGAHDASPVPPSTLDAAVRALQAAGFSVNSVAGALTMAPHCDTLHDVAIQVAKDALQRADEAIQLFRQSRDCEGAA